MGGKKKKLDRDLSEEKLLFRDEKDESIDPDGSQKR